MENVARFLSSNFTLTFFVIGLIASSVALMRKPKPLTAAVVVEGRSSPFRSVLHRLQLFLEFRCAHVFRRTDRGVHRLGG